MTQNERTMHARWTIENGFGKQCIYCLAHYRTLPALCIDSYGNRNSLITSEIDNFRIILVWISKETVWLKSLNLSAVNWQTSKCIQIEGKWHGNLLSEKYSTSNQSRSANWIMIVKVYHIDLHPMSCVNSTHSEIINDVVATGIKTLQIPGWQLSAKLIGVSRSSSHRSTFVYYESCFRD